VEQVSQETGASTRGLRAIMNALTALDFLSKDSDGRYALTPESEAFLVSTKPAFQGGIFRHASEQLMPKWLQMNEVVRTGKPAIAANEQGDAAAFFEQFVEDIFPMSYAAAGMLGDVLNIAQVSEPVRVLDIGAGSGVWGIALAQKSPRVEVTAVDFPGVIPVTRRVAERFGVADRFRFIEGDLREVDFGTGYNVATLGHILHGEGETHSRALLRKTFDALAPGGTIVIAEMVANEDHSGPPHAMIFAVNMLVNTEEGGTFSFGEMSGWLQEAGFEHVRTVEAPAPSPLIIATRQH
jgi:ubiquinone/menaquinone biosynthesis C-methylase UbiE